MAKYKDRPLPSIPGQPMSQGPTLGSKGPAGPSGGEHVVQGMPRRGRRPSVDVYPVSEQPQRLSGGSTTGQRNSDGDTPKGHTGNTSVGRPLPNVPGPAKDSGHPHGQHVIQGMPRQGRRPSVDVYSASEQHPGRSTGQRHSGGSTGQRNSGGSTGQRNSGGSTGQRYSGESTGLRNSGGETPNAVQMKGHNANKPMGRPLPSVPVPAVDDDGPPLEPAPKPPGPPGTEFKGRRDRRPSLPATPCQPMYPADMPKPPPACKAQNGYIAPDVKVNSLKVAVAPPPASHHRTSSAPNYQNMPKGSPSGYQNIPSMKDRDYQNAFADKIPEEPPPPPPPAHQRGRRPSCPVIMARPRTPSPDYPADIPDPRDRRPSLDETRGGLKRLVGSPAAEQNRNIWNKIGKNNNSEASRNEHNDQLNLEGYIRMDRCSVHPKGTTQQKRNSPPQMPAFKEEDDNYIQAKPAAKHLHASTDEPDNYVSAYPTTTPERHSSTRAMSSRRNSIMPPGLEDDADTTQPSRDSQVKEPTPGPPRTTRPAPLKVAGLQTVYGDPKDYDNEFEKRFTFPPPGDWPEVAAWSALCKHYPSVSGNTNRFTVMQD